jgi:RNA polymerase sigma factor (sigma-70 family)
VIGGVRSSMATGQDDNGHALQWFEDFLALIRHALSSKIGNESDIDDLAQEVYLRLLRVPKPELVESPKAYVYRVAMNVAHEWMQSSARRLPHSSGELAEILARESTEGDHAKFERRLRVQKTLAELPKASATALILHTRDNLTYEEIAVHMGVSRRAVKRYVANGYAVLREALVDLRSDDRSPIKQPKSRDQKQGRGYEG